MPETIKVEVDEALARKFRRRAMEIYGYKRGTVKKAMEEMMKKFSFGGKADWHSLKGKIKSDMSSVQLKYSAWRKAVDLNRRKHNT